MSDLNYTPEGSGGGSTSRGDSDQSDGSAEPSFRYDQLEFLEDPDNRPMADPESGATPAELRPGGASDRQSSQQDEESVLGFTKPEQPYSKDTKLSELLDKEYGNGVGSSVKQLMGLGIGALMAGGGPPGLAAGVVLVVGGEMADQNIGTSLSEAINERFFGSPNPGGSSGGAPGQRRGGFEERWMGR